MAQSPPVPVGGGRFTFETLPAPPRIVKRGDPDALRREALALRRLAGTGLAPTLTAHQRGALTTTRVDGASRALDSLPTAAARRLGADLRRLHEVAHRDRGGRHVWPKPVRTLRAYGARRAADLGAIPRGYRAIARRVVNAFAAIDDGRPAPFRMLHGDLTAANILWAPHPVFVDWEFWRWGDPAEDLAYLVAINDIPARVARAILAGYGDPTMAARVAAWHDMTALDAAIWLLDAGDTARADLLISRVGR